MDSNKGNRTAFMTHNGLKVRLNHEFCIQNVEEKNILPWYISIEAFDSLRGILSIIGAIIMMLLHKDTLYSGIVIVIMYFIGFIISQSYFYMVILNMIYGIFYMAYSFIERFFIQYIALVIISIISKEVRVLLVFIGVRLACFVVMNIINIIRLKYYYGKYRIHMGDVEITAAKILQFYSDKNLNFKQWIREYSNYINSEK